MGLAGTAIFSLLLLLLSLGVGLLPARDRGAVPGRVRLRDVGHGVARVRPGRRPLRYDLPALTVRHSARPGFSGWLRTLWQQFTDGPMWRGVASAGISTILGLIVLPIVGALSSSVVLLFAPLIGEDAARIPATDVQIGIEAAVPVGIVGIIVSLALLIGAALLHAVLTRRSSCRAVRRCSWSRPARPARSARARCAPANWSARASNATSTTASSRGSCPSG
jgi:hypothetical protein